MKEILENHNPVFGVLGGGSWAIAIVKLLICNKRPVNWYMRDKNAIDHIRKYHHHAKYLPAVELDPSAFNITDNPDEAVNVSDILIFAIPSAYFLKEEEKIKTSYDGKMIISAIKGFVGDKYYTVAEYFHHVYKIPYERLGVISGPCHAEEVGMQKLSYMTISSKHGYVAEYLCNLFKSYYVKTVPCTDIYGVEYAAALKNVYAIAAGICSGIGYGDNFIAVLIASCFRELKEFINVTKPCLKRNTSKSAYLGDLLVTCNSIYSRNRTFGSMLGKGYDVHSAMIELQQVAEGYFATKSIHEINNGFGIDMPIADAVYAILYENKYAVKVMNKLEESLM